MPRIAFVPAVALTLSLTASPAFAIECFSMYDAKNTLVYQSSTTPIDLSRSISGPMTRRFPGRYLVISDLGSCPATASVESNTPTQAAALLPSSNGDGPGVFGADATSPAPSSQGNQASDLFPARTYARALSGARR
jgi:hypothetical protein